MYLAICQGSPRNLNSIVKLGINRKNSDKKLPTVTKYKVINKFNKVSLVLYKPLTGRMHQLRIVSKYLNCPIIGDEKYSINNKYTKLKLLGSGEVKEKFDIEVNFISKSAKEKIEKSGGKVTLIK